MQMNASFRRGPGRHAHGPGYLLTVLLALASACALAQDTPRIIRNLPQSQELPRRLNLPLFSANPLPIAREVLASTTGLPVLDAHRGRLRQTSVIQLDPRRRRTATVPMSLDLGGGASLSKPMHLSADGFRTTITSGGALADDYLVSLVYSAQGLRGFVFANGRTYSIWPGTDGNEAIVAQINPALLPEEADPVPVRGRAGAATRTGRLQQALSSSPHVHRLLVVYTDDVAATHPAAENGIRSAVEMANMTYRNSGIHLRLELAAAVTLDYAESADLGTDRDRLKRTADGQLDQAHALRDRHAADLVLLIVNDPGDSCGIANLHLVSSDADDDSAFAVMGFNCFAGNTLTHELAHIAGAHHNTGQDPSPMPAYAHGWTRPDQFGPGAGWRSTMGYNTGGCDKDLNNCPRFPLAFSNPGVQVGGKPAGNATANNARRVAETAQTLGGFRIDGPRISLYEGASGTQDHVCVVSVRADGSTDFTGTPNPRNCDNDEARSARLFDVPAGRTVRLFDSPQGSRQDDWIEITTRRAVAEKLIPGFQRSFEDADVRVVHHRNNGLDGKVSRLETASGPSGPTMVLYEGGSGTQNQVCTLDVGQTATVRFPGHPECDNDEARSAVLFNINAGTVIRLYDSPDGSRDDDWTELVAESDVAEVRIDTFEKTRRWGAVNAIHRANNGLDGKLSRVEVLTGGGATGPLVTLKEGNDGRQNTVCTLAVGQAQQVRFPGHPECDDDEARSMILSQVPANTTFLLFDSASRNLDDDWVAIRTKRAIADRTIGSFERNVSDADVEMVYHRNNGLDGKVSRFEVSLSGVSGGVATLYEGNHATQNKVCGIALADSEVRFSGNGSCDNDEARSLVLTLARAGTRVSLYDSPDCRTNDDHTIVRAKRDLFRKVIGSFERSFSDDDVEVVFRRSNGLDGKVSCMRLETP